MTKPLSEQLADLSVRARNAESAATAAQKEAHDKIVARKEQAHAAATSAIETVKQDINSAGETVGKNWSAARAKIDADMSVLKAKVAHAKHDLDVKRTERDADDLEREAAFAIDYAIASVEQARFAVLDAIDGRLAAEEARRT